MLLAEKIEAHLCVMDGVPDRPLAEAIFGTRDRARQINQGCRYMAQRGAVVRRLRADGLIGNFLVRPKPSLRLVRPADSSK